MATMNGGAVMDIDMDIKELEAFVYVVENCSFSRAAELLHLTQPTISSHISALERKLGIKLVVRTTKETYPSDAGKRAMELCEKLEIPYLTVDPIKCSLTTDEITAFYKESGVHIYTDEGDVVYMGNGFIALHSAKSGKKTLNLTHPLTLIPVFGSDIEVKRCKTLTLDLSENNTALFKIPDDN
jgi:DNA-binding CsgD family transcriptional regulator